MNNPLPVSLDLRSVFAQLGIGPDDLILVHYHPILDRLVGGSAQLLDELAKYLNEGTICTFQEMVQYQEVFQGDLTKLDHYAKIVRDFDFKRYRDSLYHPLLLAMNRLPGRVFHQHPIVVFCGWGHDARYLTSLEGDDFPFGQDSPFRGLYDLKAKVLCFNQQYDQLDELTYGYVFDNQQPIRLVRTYLNQEQQTYLEYQRTPEKYQQAVTMVEKKKSIQYESINFTLFDYQQACQNLISL